MKAILIEQFGVKQTEPSTMYSKQHYDAARPELLCIFRFCTVDNYLEVAEVGQAMYTRISLHNVSCGKYVCKKVLKTDDVGYR